MLLYSLVHVAVVVFVVVVVVAFSSLFFDLGSW
jgi:hypothetical protein